MELNHLPPIDWELGTKLAGNKRDLAEDMLGLLIKNLPNDVHAIQRIGKSENYPELLRHVHKLHGAVCYCGAPRLKHLLSSLETELKNNVMSYVPSRLDQLDIEVTLLLEHFPLPSPGLKQENGSY